MKLLLAIFSTAIFTANLTAQPLSLAKFKNLDKDGNGQLSWEELNQKAVPAAPAEPARKAKPAPPAPVEMVRASTVADSLDSDDEESPIDKLVDIIAVQKSFLGNDDDALPARFTWGNSSGSGEYYSLDFALQYTGSQGILQRGPWQIAPTFEAHTSTEEGEVQDSLSFRVPATAFFDAPNEGQHVLTVSPVWETDREQKSETVGGDFFYTFNDSDKIGNVNDVKIGGKKVGDLSYRVRPWLGFEGGSYLDDGGIPEVLGIDDYFRIVPKLQFSLFLNQQLELTAEYLYRTDLVNDMSYHFFEGTVAYYLDADERYSIGATYKNGNTTPQFTDVDSIEAWFGLKF